MTAAERGLGVLDAAQAVALTLAVVMVTALPPLSSAFALTPPEAGALVAAGTIGALGLAVCFLAGLLRSPRLVPALPLFGAGVALWIVAVLVVAPLADWRVAIGTAWLASELLIVAAWFALRGYPAKAYPMLLVLVVAALVAATANDFLVLVAALVAGPLAVFALVALLLRRDRHDGGEGYPTPPAA